ncbi:MMPL family transporter [Paraliomyxa miuraensis]|uniref:MMPL family transporter n=1 Tax=Paraliomyxa miuraensis TaxID=376150 RepID=UPI0022598B8B|nr:MMPL family transporter [Paraliomyxa miuraensis]
MALLVVAVLLSWGTWAGMRLRVVTDIRHFIPTEADRQLSEISAALADSSLTRTSVLLVEGERPVEAAKHLSAALQQHPEVEWLRTGLDETLESTVHELYFPRRVALVRADLTDEGLRRAAADLQRALAGPKGPLVRQLAPSDPLLLFTGFLQGLREGDGQALDLQDGQLVTAGGTAAAAENEHVVENENAAENENETAAVLFVRTRSSAFASEPQAAFQADLARMMDAVRAEVDGSATLHQSGLSRFAIAAERATVADVTRVSTISTISIILLFLVVFGQLRAIVLTYAPVVLGVGGGILGCSLLVEQVHGLTLAFGSALLGVGVDYAVHLMFHLGLRGERGAAEVVARVRPGLLLGAATTVVGLGGLGLTSFPGMRELALFGAVGVGGSLLVTLVLVPAFATRLPDRRAHRWVVGIARGILARVERFGARAWVVFVAIALSGAWGLYSLQWSDGLRALYEVDAELLAEDTRVRERTGAIDMSRMVLARGDDLPQALERNQQVFAAVDEAARSGDLAGYRSVQPWLPSTQWQQHNVQRWLEPGVRERFDAAFEAEGFRAGVFGQFFDELSSSPPQPLTMADLQGTVLEPLVEPFVLRLGGAEEGGPEGQGVVVVTWLRGDVPASLREAVQRIPGVELFDQQEFLDRAYGRYRIEMIQMLAVGLLAVLAIIFGYYRRWRPTLAAFLPAIAGALGAIGVTGGLEGSANLVHGASLLLVCSMGVDYGVFMVESRGELDEHAVTLASSILAGITTISSFGLLAMSDNPALASVGRSVAVGVLCALITTPVAATLRERREERAR